MEGVDVRVIVHLIVSSHADLIGANRKEWKGSWSG